jgi:ParB/RepB/Spo0J family partition protein
MEQLIEEIQTKTDAKVVESMSDAQQVSLISLTAIVVSATNGIFRRPHELTPEALAELTGSISQYGVIQPILVRPDYQQEGQFILICGERRYRASLLAGKTEIVAYVRNVTDEVALILQITENIHREGVHPLNEAKGYKLMMEADITMTTAELALRFGKSETYIIQRLKLNDLVKEARKHFYENRMHLGHAIIMCRLLPSDQKEIIRQYVSRNNYGTVANLESYVERNIINTLSTAPFDKKDTELVKKAGACIDCPKRSGASPLLFAEIKEKDKCFDRGCFLAKCEKFLLTKAKEVVETQPDIVFLSDGYSEPDEKIVATLTEHKLKPLKQHDDFNTYDSGGSKVQGLWISGSKAGHVTPVFLKKAVKEMPQGEAGLQAQVEKIKYRMERGRELDREKIYAKVLEALKIHPSQKKNFNEKMIPDEEVMLWFIIFDKGGYHIKDELLRALGVSKDSPERLYSALKTAKAEERAFILRRVIIDQYGGNYPDSNHGFIITKIAAGYGDIDIASFEKQQAEICEKRESRANARIAELKKTSDVLQKVKQEPKTSKRKSKGKVKKTKKRV